MFQIQGILYSNRPQIHFKLLWLFCFLFFVFLFLFSYIYIIKYPSWGKIVFKPFKYILTTFQKVSKYSWFGKWSTSLNKSLYKDILFLCARWGSGPYISRNFLIWTQFVNASLKNRTYVCTFPVQCKEIKVVKVRFTMRYSSRKLNNEKVITTTCNFRRQIACTYQVTNGNISYLGKKKYLKSRHFFKPGQGILVKKVHACSSRFSALKAERAWCAKLQTKLMNVKFRPRSYLSTFETGRIGMCLHCTKEWHKTHIRYVTLHWSSISARCSFTLLQKWRPGATTVLVCEQKAFLVWFSWRRKNCPVPNVNKASVTIYYVPGEER